MQSCMQHVRPHPHPSIQQVQHDQSQHAPNEAPFNKPQQQCGHESETPLLQDQPLPQLEGGEGPREDPSLSSPPLAVSHVGLPPADDESFQVHPPEQAPLCSLPAQPAPLARGSASFVCLCMNAVLLGIHVYGCCTSRSRPWHGRVAAVNASTFFGYVPSSGRSTSVPQHSGDGCGDGCGGLQSNLRALTLALKRWAEVPVWLGPRGGGKGGPPGMPEAPAQVRAVS